MLGKSRAIGCYLFALLMVDSAHSSTKDSKDDDDYHILACTRPIHKGKSLPDYFEHCYVKIVKGMRVIESRGYFQDAGSSQESLSSIFIGKCTMAKEKATLEDWGKVTGIYDKYEAKHYDLLSHNCCSVAEEAIKAIVKKVPSNITAANSAIGTKYKSSKKKDDGTDT